MSLSPYVWRPDSLIVPISTILAKNMVSLFYFRVETTRLVQAHLIAYICMYLIIIVVP